MVNYFLLSLLFSLAAFAGENNCPNIDLRSNPVLGTVRAQGRLGWCFAFTAADMYSMALNKRVSPFDIAANYYRNYGDSNEKRLTKMRGGTQIRVFQTVTEHGICPDKYFSAYQHESVQGLFLLDELLNSQAGTRELYSNYHKFYKVFPMTSAPVIRNAISNSDPREIPLIALADEICREKRIPVNNLKKVSNRGGKTTAFAFLNKHLREGRIVAIGYNADSIKKGTPLPDMNHISSIVASRKINGKCEYLLRNSWGDSRKSIHESLQPKFDGDYLWLTEEFVREMAAGLHAIVPEGNT